MQATKAIIRRPAPAFTGQAWWNDKFQQISLEDFKGKFLTACLSKKLSCFLFVGPMKQLI
jgi:hypothetical protein